jgi:hypothetical protein
MTLTRGSLENQEMRSWEDLDPVEQTDLRIAFGYYLDGLPPTCSMETKIQRFRHWLQQQGIDYRESL